MMSAMSVATVLFVFSICSLCEEDRPRVYADAETLEVDLKPAIEEAAVAYSVAVSPVANEEDKGVLSVAWCRSLRRWLTAGMILWPLAYRVFGDVDATRIGGLLEALAELHAGTLLEVLFRTLLVAVLLEGCGAAARWGRRPKRGKGESAVVGSMSTVPREM